MILMSLYYDQLIKFEYFQEKDLNNFQFLIFKGLQNFYTCHWELLIVTFRVCDKKNFMPVSTTLQTILIGNEISQNLFTSRRKLILDGSYHDNDTHISVRNLEFHAFMYCFPP